MVKLANDLFSMKRAQVFLFDLILSIVILLVSVSIFFLNFSTSQHSLDLHELSQEVMTALTRTQMKSLNSEEIRDMFINNQIRTPEHRVSQQLAEFQYLGETALAENLAESFLDDFIPRQVNARLRLSNASDVFILYEEGLSGTSFEEASASSSVSRSVFGRLNRTTLFGPYQLELEVWQ